MIFDQVTPAQMRTAQVMSGVAFAAFLAAQMFGPRAGMIRMAVAGLYIAGVLGFLLYFLV